MAFLALGGSSYAAFSVTGKDVKNGSLTGADIRNSSLTGSDVKNDTLTGADITRADSADFFVACQPGELAAGGGARFFDSRGVPMHETGDVVASSGPVTRADADVTDGQAPAGWDTFVSTPTADGRTVVFYATCVAQ